MSMARMRSNSMFEQRGGMRGSDVLGLRIMLMLLIRIANEIK